MGFKNRISSTKILYSYWRFPAIFDIYVITGSNNNNIHAASLFFPPLSLPSFFAPPPLSPCIPLLPPSLPAFLFAPSLPAFLFFAPLSLHPFFAPPPPLSLHPFIAPLSPCLPFCPLSPCLPFCPLSLSTSLPPFLCLYIFLLSLFPFSLSEQNIRATNSVGLSNSAIFLYFRRLSDVPVFLRCSHQGPG